MANYSKELFCTTENGIIFKENIKAMRIQNWQNCKIKVLPQSFILFEGIEFCSRETASSFLSFFVKRNQNKTRYCHLCSSIISISNGLQYHYFNWKYWYLYLFEMTHWVHHEKEFLIAKAIQVDILCEYISYFVYHIYSLIA